MSDKEKKLKEKILKLAKRLNQFTANDLLIISGIEERFLTLILNELIKEAQIIKANNGKFVYLGSIKKRNVLPITKANVSFYNASINFMEKAKTKCTVLTYKSYKSNLENHLIPFFRGFQAIEIKPENIDILIKRKLAEGLSPKSINNIVILLGTILEKALKERYIPYNPVRAVERL